MARRVSAEQVAYVPAGEAGVSGRFVTVDEDGPTDQLVTWVDDAPGDDTDPAGHFEVYTGKAADYRAS